MINVTRLGGGAIVVNADLILTIEQRPDTVLALMNGDKLFVRESPEQLIDRILEYRRRAAGIDRLSPQSGCESHGA